MLGGSRLKSVTFSFVRRFHWYSRKEEPVLKLMCPGLRLPEGFVVTKDTLLTSSFDDNDSFETITESCISWAFQRRSCFNAPSTVGWIISSKGSHQTTYNLVETKVWKLKSNNKLLESHRRSLQYEILGAVRGFYKTYKIHYSLELIDWSPENQWASIASQWSQRSNIYWGCCICLLVRKRPSLVSLWTADDGCHMIRVFPDWILSFVVHRNPDFESSIGGLLAPFSIMTALKSLLQFL